jgi:hypothetical protein
MWLLLYHHFTDDKLDLRKVKGPCPWQHKYYTVDSGQIVIIDIMPSYDNNYFKFMGQILNMWHVTGTLLTASRISKQCVFDGAATVP